LVVDEEAQDQRSGSAEHDRTVAGAPEIAGHELMRIFGSLTSNTSSLVHHT
jgi:hypothetical protein